MRGKKAKVITLAILTIAVLAALVARPDVALPESGSTSTTGTTAAPPPAPPPYVCHRKPLNPRRLTPKEKKVVYGRVNAWFAHHPNIDKTYPRWKCEVIHQGRIYRQQVAAAVARLWRAQDRKFTLALRYAAKRYHVSYNRLLNCALSEGLHRPSEPWVMNSQGSGAGGWLQFMESTLRGNVKHVAIPRQYKHWHSKVGQAYTGAYMFHIGQSGQWAGAGCN